MSNEDNMANYWVALRKHCNQFIKENSWQVITIIADGPPYIYSGVIASWWFCGLKKFVIDCTRSAAAYV